jgi:hypothetical protein
MMLPLDERSPHAVLARRELVLAAVILVAFTRLVEPADAFLISGLLPVVMLLAGIGVLGSDRNRRPFENLLVAAVLTVDVALVALLLGYRLAVLRYGSAADAARSAVTYAIVVAVAAGATRAIGLPLVAGPVILTLVFYLWDALHGTAPARRRQPRFLVELGVLVLVGAVVVAWNLQIAG